MKIAVNRAHHPVTTLGYGTRVGIWLQGCSIGCAGCMSTDTWASGGDRLMDLDVLVAWIAEAGDVDGVTISGGEPFEQPAALHALLEALHRWRAGIHHPVDLLAYSGLSLRRLQQEHGGILDLLDVVIPEPFIESRPPATWRGSDNQQLVPLSRLGQGRYTAPAPGGPRLQVAVDPDGISYIGIPARGDLEAIEQALERRGIHQETVSWRR